MNADHLIETLTTGWIPVMIFLVWLFLHTIQERFAEWFAKPKPLWRLLPFLPAFVTIPAAFVPGPWIPPETAFIEKLLIGCCMGVASYYFGGIANRLGLGKLINLLGVSFVVEKTRGGGQAHGEEDQGVVVGDAAVDVHQDPVAPSTTPPG